MLNTPRHRLFVTETSMRRACPEHPACKYQNKGHIPQRYKDKANSITPSKEAIYFFPPTSIQERISSLSCDSRRLLRLSMLGCIFPPLALFHVVLPVPSTLGWLRVGRWFETLARLLPAWLASSSIRTGFDLVKVRGGRLRPHRDGPWLVGLFCCQLPAPIASLDGTTCVVFLGLPRRAVAILGSRTRRYGSCEDDSRSRHRGWTSHFVKGLADSSFR